MEPGRIIVSAKDLGLTGYKLQELLVEEDNIHIEFSDNFYIACMLGLGAEERDIVRLTEACRRISEKYENGVPLREWRNKLPEMPEALMTPRQAYIAETETVSWENAKGRISADMIVPYPPGIPALCPGEVISDDVWSFLEDQSRQGIHLHGIKGGKLDKVRVVKEEAVYDM